MSHNGNEWMVKVVCGMHNHFFMQHFKGHTYARMLTSSKLDLLVDMSKCNVRTTYIIYIIKQHDENNVIILKYIYNACLKYRVNEKI